MSVVPSPSGPRVLQVVLSLHPGGTERLVLDLVTRLDATMPMRVCCLDEPGLWAAQLEAAGIRVDTLGRRAGFHPGLGRAIAGLARRHDAGVIHAHHYSPFVYSCLSKIWRPSTPIVFTEHGRVSDTPPSPKRRLANQVLSRVPRRVFAVSGHLKGHMLQEGFPDRTIDVIHNGIDLRAAAPPDLRADVRTSLGAADDVFVVGTIARLDPVKDLGTLIRAAAGLGRDRPVLVVIVGDGPDRGQLENVAAETGMSDRVRFLGHRDDARRWLAGCDAFANSSLSEGVSLTILEAMAASLPVVATAVGGTPEVVDAHCGRLVPSRDPAAFEAALRDLAGEAALRSALGRAGRTRVEAFFSLDRMVQAYADVYREVA